MNIKELNENQIEKIKMLTEEMIETIGFNVQNNTLLKKAKKAGAIVDDISMTVKIPKKLLRELLNNIPKSFVIKGIDGKEYKIGGDKQYIWAIVVDPWIIDYYTQKPRRPSLEDIKINTILAQKNEDVAAMSRMDFPVTDYSDNTSSLRALETHLLNHVKHNVLMISSLENLKVCMETGEIIADGKGFANSKLASVGVSIISPLILSDLNSKILLEATKRNFAVIPTTCPIAGMTSPYTIGNTLLQGNVETIFLAALTQIINPGNPYLYALGPSVCDLYTGFDLYYTIDKVLWKIAGTELAKSYNIPNVAECGGTLSHRYDMQSGAESILFMLTAQNTGASIISGLGSCFNANGLSSEMIIIQSEWFRISKFLSRGINLHYLEEGINSIQSRGHGGNFLSDDLTIKFVRSDEFFKSDLLDTTGGFKSVPSLLENAHRKVKELTEGYNSPVPENIQENLRRYFYNLYKKMNS